MLMPHLSNLLVLLASFSVDLHLLRDHHSKACQSCSSNPRDGEKLSKACQIIVLADNASFDLQLAMDVVEIPRRLQWMVSKL